MNYSESVSTEKGAAMQICHAMHFPNSDEIVCARIQFHSNLLSLCEPERVSQGVETDFISFLLKILDAVVLGNFLQPF